MKIPEYLLNKYNVAVPRYTSYPPANHFPDDFTSDDYTGLVLDSNAGNPRHIALYVHIPFCRKICFYCGCNACPTGKGDLIGPYIDALIKEIGMVARLLDKDRVVTQIHYGGGTPNSIPSEMLSRINEFILKEFTLSAHPEIAIECHPAYLDERYVDELAAAGFNRFSLGIQDFNTDVLKMVNREPSRLPVGRLIEHIKGHGEGMSVNLDFIYGLPGQSVDSFTHTIREAIALRPDRLVTFSYAHVPWIKKHQQILEKRGLPGAEEKISIFLAAYGLLKEAGYQPIGLDHYVLPDDELYTALKNNLLHRNFQGYCTRSTTGQVYAFGSSSISQLAGGYAQNLKEPGPYIEKISEGSFATEKGLLLTAGQKIVREVITDLMCNKRIEWAATAERLGLPVQELKSTIVLDPSALADFEQDGLLQASPDGLSLTETGALFIRNIAASLDPAFNSETHKYSKSV